MPRTDPDRRRKLRGAIRYLVAKETLERGHQAQLAKHFDVSRQWVHQIVIDERRRLNQAGAELAYPRT